MQAEISKTGEDLDQVIQLRLPRILQSLLPAMLALILFHQAVSVADRFDGR